MIRKWFAIPLLIVFFSGCSLLPERTLVFEELNFKCKVPCTWILLDKPGFILDAIRWGGGSLLINVKPSTISTVNARFLSEMSAKLHTDGYEVLSDNMLPFEGIVACSVTFRKRLNNRLVYGHAVNFVVGKWRYNLITTRKEIDPTEDAELQRALTSFQILDPPLKNPGRQPPAARN